MTAIEYAKNLNVTTPHSGIEPEALARTQEICFGEVLSQEIFRRGLGEKLGLSRDYF